MVNIDELKKVQCIQLMIAKEFKRICDKYDIAYSISGGSLLGAVRHSGFIPWDDDFDVEMLRCDFERFQKAAETELQKNFFLETWNTDSHFAFPYAKLMLKDTVFSEKIAENVHINKMIFIDIFIADSVPDTSFLCKLQCKICDNLIGVLLLKNHYLSVPQKRIKKFLYKLLSSLLPLAVLQKCLFFFMTLFNQKETANTSLFGSCYGSLKEVKSRAFFDTLTEYPFEDTTFKGFQDFDAYLTGVFGDYMQFPPEEERYNRHGVIKLDFGPY